MGKLKMGRREEGEKKERKKERKRRPKKTGRKGGKEGRREGRKEERKRGREEERKKGRKEERKKGREERKERGEREAEQVNMISMFREKAIIKHVAGFMSKLQISLVPRNEASSRLKPTQPFPNPSSRTY